VYLHIYVIRGHERTQKQTLRLAVLHYSILPQPILPLLPLYLYLYIYTHIHVHYHPLERVRFCKIIRNEKRERKNKFALHFAAYVSCSCLSFYFRRLRPSSLPRVGISPLSCTYKARPEETHYTRVLILLRSLYAGNSVPDKRLVFHMYLYSIACMGSYTNHDMLTKTL